jgi:tetratricopeptide (TPR) repeat protein
MKDIVEAFFTRVKSPLFGYFVFSVIAINWKAISLLLFSTDDLLDKIEIFDEATSRYCLFIYPLILSIFLTITYPWINYLFLLIARKPTELRNLLQAESEHKMLQKKVELETLRSEYLGSKERELLERAKINEEVENIDNEEVKTKLQSEIKELRKQIDESNSKGIRTPSEITYLTNTHKELAKSYEQAGEHEKAQKVLIEAKELEKKYIEGLSSINLN